MQGAIASRGVRPIAKSKSNSTLCEIQYAALPYRLTDAGGVEILLVTSRSGRRWILPKGSPVDGLTPADAAAREAFEAAGVRGTVREAPIGHFLYDRRIDDDGRSLTTKVAVFPLEVIRQHQIWPAVWQRETRWLAPRDAAALLEDAGLKPLLQAFANRMDTGKPAAHRRMRTEAAILSAPNDG